jgi:ribonuclease T2
MILTSLITLLVAGTSIIVYANAKDCTHQPTNMRVRESTALVKTPTIDPSTIYVFAYSWTPGFCSGQPSYPGCKNPEEYWKYNLTVHGLWPQYATTGYPSFCSKEPFDPSVPELIGMDTMYTYWPDVKYDASSSNYDSFWEHEWSKHGTCSGLTQLEYFNQTVHLAQILETTPYISENIYGNASTSNIRKEYGGDTHALLQCDGSKLVGIYTCWNQTSGFPTTQTACPDSIIHEDTCTGSPYVYIAGL